MSLLRNQNSFITFKPSLIRHKCPKKIVLYCPYFQNQPITNELIFKCSLIQTDQSQHVRIRPPCCTCHIFKALKARATALIFDMKISDLQRFNLTNLYKIVEKNVEEVLDHQARKRKSAGRPNDSQEQKKKRSVFCTCFSQIRGLGLSNLFKYFKIFAVIVIFYFFFILTAINYCLIFMTLIIIMV